jgi:hypothetical protein
VLRRRFSRPQLIRFVATLPACVVGMEPFHVGCRCASSWARDGGLPRLGSQPPDRNERSRTATLQHLEVRPPRSSRLRSSSPVTTATTSTKLTSTRKVGCPARRPSNAPRAQLARRPASPPKHHICAAALG